MPSQTEMISAPFAPAMDDHADVACALVEEQRSAMRLTSSISVVLKEARGTDNYACVTTDISESGVYLRVASEVGLAVGQRCELSFTNQPTTPELASLCDESCYATVVRTERLNDTTPSATGAGLRFDQPLFF